MNRSRRTHSGFLFAGVVGDHDELANALSLDKKPADDKAEDTITKLSIEGGLSCDMEPKQKTWIAIIFLSQRMRSRARYA